jgi:hypothetical protein
MQPADADVKNIPSSINLAGSKVGLRILKPDEVKRLGSECVPESPGECNRGTENCTVLY